jgi:hypothetical protein
MSLIAEPLKTLLILRGEGALPATGYFYLNLHCLWLLFEMMSIEIKKIYAIIQATTILVIKPHSAMLKEA